jgi:hypothetical protein
MVLLASVTTFKMLFPRKEVMMAYNHIIDNVLGRSDGTATKTSLDEEVNDDIFGIINISGAEIDSLSYKDISNYNVVTPVRYGNKKLLRGFTNYVANHHLELKPIGNDWIMVTQKEFDSFRIDPGKMLSLASNAPPNISATIAAKPTSAVQ